MSVVFPGEAYENAVHMLLLCHVRTNSGGHAGEVALVDRALWQVWNSFVSQIASSLD